MSITEVKASPTGLTPIGAPILPGGTEAHIRKMVMGNLYIAEADGLGLMACSPHWIVPGATVEPVMLAAGLALEPGSYQVFPTGRSKEPKVHRLEHEPPTAMIRQHVEAALAAAGPVYHETHHGVPLIAASWDYTNGEDGWAYVMDRDFGLRTVYLDWLTRKAVPEHRAEDRHCRVDEGVYRIRAIGGADKPVAVWVEQYLNARYLSNTSTRTVVRRTCYVLMPIRWPKNG